MQIDMTKAQPQEVQEIKEEPKEQMFNLSLTLEELQIIKRALARSKNVEAYINAIDGAKEYKILLDLDSIK